MTEAAALIVVVSLFALGGCTSVPRDGSTLVRVDAKLLSNDEVKSIARAVRVSLNLPDSNAPLPPVAYLDAFPVKCGSGGCPLGMYRKGQIFIWKGLPYRYYPMVVAHELIHYYSDIYDLGMGEQEVRAQASRAGYEAPAYAALGRGSH